ncbi:acyl transferase domain-containing protein [Aspergillus venezuelensis]
MDQSSFLRDICSGKTRLYACCGGQGANNLTGLDELVHLAHTYQNCQPVQQLLEISASRLESLASTTYCSSFYSGRGFPLKAWLDDSATSAPPTHELALSPYSFPINTLLSLTHYIIAADSLGLNPTQLRDRLHGAIGHSQGLFAAVALCHAGTGWSDFYNAATFSLELSFLVGLEAHLTAPGSTLGENEASDCLQHGEGAPSHLLSVAGLQVEHVRHVIKGINQQGKDNEAKVNLSLINGYNKCVLAGPPHGLRKVCLELRRLKASPGSDQSRVPFSRRRPVIDVQFLPVSAPYHSPLLECVQPRVLDNVGDARLAGKDLAVPVYCGMNGTIQNLKDYGTDNLVPIIIKSVLIEPVDWPGLCSKLENATHILSFGPGAAGNMTQDVMKGTGVKLINLSGRSIWSALRSLKSTSYSNLLHNEQHWGSQYSPCLCRKRGNQGEEEDYIETKVTRLLGTPHVMVAGMTPTTCSPEFVAAVMEAGYHVEFACGGYHQPAALEAALRQLAATIPLHRSITCNVIYASPKHLSWQIKLLRDLIAEGLPIDGLTVGAGIPSPEVVTEWIASLGVSHIWFKPGTVEAIDSVISIARRHSTFPIGLQWTGGRAGGHHSCEDFHQPLLATYSRIRECENIVLVAGSGFGGAEDTWPYLTGSWSHELGFAAMPVDGVLLGSRMMVAGEAKTSLEAKQLIVNSTGISDSPSGAWACSDHEEVGGVISVVSEMGQPMHVLATRAMRLWHEFDRRFFSINNSKQLELALHQHRQEIVTRLNADYARPWFAMRGNGEPTELADLSYRQVLYRLCELMFVRHQSRWLDASYLDVVHYFIRLVQARFGSTVPLSDDPTLLQTAFDAAYGSQADKALYPDDLSRLVALFRQPGKKPVPFIPTLDDSFETWFKKDTLWQSEDVDAVGDQDVQRTCIIQGPVAAQYSKVCNEPVKDILDNIQHAHVRLLRKHYPDGKADALETCVARPHKNTLPGVETLRQGTKVRYHLVGPAIPSSEALIEQLIGDCPPAWARACLVHESFAFGRTRVRNPVRDAFKPGMGDLVEIRYNGNEMNSVSLCAAGSRGMNRREESVSLELKRSNTGEVAVSLFIDSSGTMSKGTVLKFTIPFHTGSHGKGIFQIKQNNYLAGTRKLYAELWNGGIVPEPSSVGLNSEFTGESARISSEHVKAFLDVVRQAGPAGCRDWQPRGSIVPLDYTVVIAWTALTKPLLVAGLEADLIKLLHQSISMKRVPGTSPLRSGDVVRTSSRITERTITPTGQRVQVSAEILRHGKPVVQLNAAFVIKRRPQGDAHQQFHSVEEPDMILNVSSPVILQLLVSRKWLVLDGSSSDLLGQKVLFRLNSQTVYDTAGTPCLTVSGSVTVLRESSCPDPALGTKIGMVYLEEQGQRTNSVMDFLQRHARPRVERHLLQNPGWSGNRSMQFRAPSQSGLYAMVSHDTNPIHVCPLFARFAGLREPVVHGMHLSATARRILEWMVGDAHRSRFQSWEVSFDGIVHANDQLRMELQHTAMEAGLMVVQVRVLNDATEEQVMHGEAILEQQSTAYVFTGQGTQEKGMGMALYTTNKAAQQMWDRAERYFESHYGISLLHIVRENPKTLTVRFGGRRGRKIRSNYLAMASDSGPDGLMLPGLTETSRSYTFTSSSGLLMSTQFAQPALAVMEMAEYAHLQSQGVVQDTALFAGHSLGEYSALGACSTFMPFESLLSLIFYRGLKMQNALPRDANGRTEYTMMAVDPSRIGPGFDENALMCLVRLISQQMSLLLEIVNHNVQSRQYVCAGHIRSLWVLGRVCDDLGSMKTPTDAEAMAECVRQRVAESSLVSNQNGLARGRATIPLSGVDIPFHSQMLRGHIDDYRQYLRRHLRIVDVKHHELVGRWIPNVVGRPFEMNTAYIRLVQEATTSEPLRQLLQRLESII